MSDPLIGRKIGPYTLRARLGGGGMGTVYEAVHELLEQVRAVKVMAPHLASHPGFVSLFRREAMLAARLRHPSIVQIHDVGDQDGLHYIVMEHLTGRSLRDVIRADSPMPIPRVLAMLRQLAAALDFAHAQHVSHRDIKPANVFVDDADRVTLVDFGIARAADGTHLTITSGIGTPEYMAPEALDDDILGPDADPFVLGVGTDRYALGVVAYELLSGRLPFTGRTPQSVAFAQVHRSPPPVRQYRPDLPEAVEPVMLRQLSKDPAGRYPTVDAFVRALDAVLQPVAAPAPRDADPATRPTLGAAGPATPARTGTTPARVPEPTPSAHVPGPTTPARPSGPNGRNGAVTPAGRAAPPPPARITPTGNGVPSRPAPPSDRPDPGTRRGRLIAAGVAALVVLALGLSLYALPMLDGAATQPARTATATTADRGTPGLLAGAAATPVPTAPPATSQPTAQPTIAAAAAAVSASTPAPPTPIPPTPIPATATPVPATPTMTAAQRLTLAEDLLNKGEAGQAIELLLAIKATDPAAPGLDDALYRAYLANGQALLDAGDLDGSWSLYAKAIELRPDAPAPRDGQTEVILMKDWRTMEAAWGKDDDAARTAAEDIYRIRPGYRDVRDKLYALLIARADGLTRAGDMDGAYRTLMFALEAKPDGAEARERLRPYTPTPVPAPPPVSAPAVRPAQSAPVQSAPAQSAPAQSAPAQSAPAQSAPAQSAPVQSVPAQAAPAPAQPAPAQPAQPAPSGAPVRR